MTASPVHVRSSIGVEAEAAGPCPRPAAQTVAERRGHAGGREGAPRHSRVPDALHSEEDRMRLAAALLVLATLVLWMLFLQG